jgi:outer membrane receptor protein involved in Fe transport
VGWSAGTGVLDPSVGVTVDGVSYGVTGIAALSNFTDIENVQVVRGPQGVDGGRQTSVGRIDITTNQPSFTPAANAEVIVGQLNHLTTTAAIDPGLLRQHRFQRTAGPVQLRQRSLWQAAATLVHAEHQFHVERLLFDQLCRPAERLSESIRDEGRSPESRGAAERKPDFESITAYQDFNYRQGRGSLLPFNTVLAPQGTSNSYWQGSEELKLDWTVNPSLKSQTGLIFFRRDFSLIGQLTRYGPDAGAWYSNAAQYASLDPVSPALPNATSAVGRDLLKSSADGLITDTRSKLNSHSLGVYSNVAWEATSKLSFTAGARATREERTASGSSLIEGGLRPGIGSSLREQR